MATGNLFGVGVTGLLASQRALATISHNVANVNTTGYSRQRVNMGTLPPQLTSAGYVGTGVQSQEVQRIQDQFLTKQLHTATSSHARFDQYATLAEEVDNLLADGQAGVSPALGSFFDAVHGVANDPAQPAARATLVAEAGVLVDRFHITGQRLDDVESRINGMMKGEIASINALAASIAEINRTIANNQGASPANDSLDQREELLRQLSEKVSVSSITQTDGTMSVFIGNGQGLVVGNTALQLTTIQNAYRPERLDIAIQAGSGAVDINSQISGGALGGLLAFRTDVLDPAQNQLGRVALGAAMAFNDQHRLGVDLDGAIGGNFFSLPALTVAPSSLNTGGGAATATLLDTNGLTAADYRLRFDGANVYSLTRLSDGQVTTINTGGAPSYTTTTIDGFRLTISSGADVGDTFMVRPTDRAAQQIGLVVTDPRKIAAAAPMRIAAGAANTGTATFAQGSTVPPAPLNVNVAASVTITFNNPPTSFNVSGTGTGNPVNVPYTSGGTISYNGWTTSITGAPGAGDTFTVTANANPSGDNRNALELGALRDRRMLVGGSASAGEAFGSMVGHVGAATRAVRVNRDAALTVREQSLQARNETAGVNFDEEAADLLRYQQAYQAAAQVVAVANSVLDTLFQAFRR